MHNLNNLPNDDFFLSGVKCNGPWNLSSDGCFEINNSYVVTDGCFEIDDSYVVTGHFYHLFEKLLCDHPWFLI